MVANGTAHNSRLRGDLCAPSIKTIWETCRCRRGHPSSTRHPGSRSASYPGPAPQVALATDPIQPPFSSAPAFRRKAEQDCGSGRGRARCAIPGRQRDRRACSPIMDHVRSRQCPQGRLRVARLSGSLPRSHLLCRRVPTMPRKRWLRSLPAPLTAPRPRRRRRRTARRRRRRSSRPSPPKQPPRAKRSARPRKPARKRGPLARSPRPSGARQPKRPRKRAVLPSGAARMRRRCSHAPAARPTRCAPPRRRHASPRRHAA